MKKQAWSFKSIEKDDLRYWGNDGYNDNSSVYYRYDSFVANHKNVKEGDVVIITNRSDILGISIIDEISIKNIQKKRNKCIHADCNAKKIRRRNKIKPQWRCNNGHEFDTPKVLYQPATEFLATYDRKFHKIDNLSMDTLIANTPRYNVQMSIQEIDLSWALSLISSKIPFNSNINSNDADIDTPILNSEDLREVIERQIKQRRGQRAFREKLLKSKPVCAVTGCELIDILEAAHIDAYRNISHNHISNGLLLRSDIHTLFDLNFCAIEPHNHTIHFTNDTIVNGYDAFEGKKINVKHKLSKTALEKRWDFFTN